MIGPLSHRLTVIVAQRGLLLRADLSGLASPRLIRLESVVAGEDESLAERVEIAARTGARPSRSTYVLTDEVFAESLDLDARASRGLDDRELGDALALEAQMHSGLSAGDAKLAWSRGQGATSSRRFLVQEISREDMNEMRERIRDCGGRLRGVVHPAGLPAEVGSSTPSHTPYKRVERWPDLIARITRTPAGRYDVDLSRQHGGARPDLHEAQSLLVAPTVSAAPAPDGIRLFDLRNADVVIQWIEAWAHVLRRRQALVLTPDRSAVSSAWRLAMGALFCAAILAVCLFDHGRLTSRRTVLAEQVRQGRQRIDALKADRSDVTKLERELRELEQAAVGSTSSTREWNSSVPVALLSCLASARPPGIVIDALSIGIDGGSVHGFSARLDGVESLLQATAADLASVRLAMHSKSRQLVRAGERAGLYEFELAIEPGGVGAVGSEVR